MGKICRGLRANWNSEMMSEALKLLREGHSTRYVEKQCGIPRTTLRNHFKTGSDTRTLGRKPILTTQQENDLETRIIRMSKLGVPLTPKTVRRSVFRFCVENNISTKFNSDKELAGYTWYRSFLKRHPKISKRKPQLMNPARAQKLNPMIVQDHFQKLGRVMSDMRVKNAPQFIYNLDEKACRLTLHHANPVLAAKGERRVHLIANEHAENVTVVACVSALGYAVPPMIIFKGVRLKDTYSDNLPPGSIVVMAEKGSMTRAIFVQWIQHFAKYKPAGNVLLIIDGAKCHLDISIVEAAEQQNISLYCLPSNTTHELQPLDKAVFKSFEHHWDLELMKYWEDNPAPSRTLKKERFGLVLTPVWEKCMSIANIQSGFRATGIYPFKPDVIPESAFSPSELSFRKPQLKEASVTHSEITDESDDDIPLIRLAENNKLKSKSSFDRLDGKGKQFLNNAKDVPPSTSKDNSESKIRILDVTIVKPTSSSGVKGKKFSELLKTPDMATAKATTPRRKALNYKGQLLKKNLFSQSTVPAEPSKNESWFCPACKKDTKLDMRMCVLCATWYHEICVGLSDNDLEDFLCPNCSE